MINMIGLKTEKIKSVPRNEFETLTEKRKSFNEGWWKGLVMGGISCTLGSIIGEVLVRISKSKGKA